MYVKSILLPNNKNFNSEKIESLQTGKFELGEGEYIITVSLK